MDNPEQTTAERVPLIAAAASYFFPGLGQVYNGQVKKGILIAVLLFPYAIIGCAVTILFLRGWTAFFTHLALFSTIHIWFVVDAYKTAKRLGSTYELKSYNRLGYYVLFIFSFFMLYQSIRLLGLVPIKFYRIAASMVPTLYPNEIVIADTRASGQEYIQNAHRGDIVTFLSPKRSNLTFISRVIGLPGDTINTHGTDVIVNKKSIGRGKVEVKRGVPFLNEKRKSYTLIKEAGDVGNYVVGWSEKETLKDATYTVPNNSVFVMGDRRDGIQDSRVFGIIPLENIKGKATFVWCNKEHNTGVCTHERWVTLDRTPELDLSNY